MEGNHKRGKAGKNKIRWTQRFQSALSPRLQLKCDGTRWRKGGEVKWKLANAVGSQYSSHYLGTWCIQHYYRWCAHLGCQQSTELTPPPGRFKWTGPFRAKDEICFLLVCHHISNAVYTQINLCLCYRTAVVGLATDRQHESASVDVGRRIGSSTWLADGCVSRRR